MGSDLAADTAVTRVATTPGAYMADLPDAWSFLMPSGGVLMTLGLRAMREELADPELRPMSATATFCSPLGPGPLRLNVEILRRGNAVAQLRASVIPAQTSGSSAGEGLDVTATFARDRRGPQTIDVEMPVVPGPTEAGLLWEGDPAARASLPFFTNFESRLAFGRPWWLPDWEPGPARFIRWMKYRKAQTLPGGALDPLAIPPVADTMPAALWTKLGPTKPRYHAPSLDLTVHFLDDTPSEWLLLNTHCRMALRGYATAQNEIWGEDGRLVAFATQTMMLRQHR